MDDKDQQDLQLFRYKYNVEFKKKTTTTMLYNQAKRHSVSLKVISAFF